MSENIEKFVGHLMTFKARGDDCDACVDEGVLLEVTDFNNAAEVEIAFTDRDERCYVRFSLADLAAHIGKHAAGTD